MCYRAVARLPCTPMSVRASRTFVTKQLVAWGVDADDSAAGRLDDITLVMSELAGNAAKFGRTEIEISLVAHRDHIEVAVSDDNPRPARLQHPDPSTPAGRGLLLVEALAEQWGQRRPNQGKTVWARLALPPGSVLADGCTLAIP
jgi:anti-sigma regulatory factor (Ser/Thr protein kinase)